MQREHQKTPVDLVSKTITLHLDGQARSHGQVFRHPEPTENRVRDYHFYASPINTILILVTLRQKVILITKIRHILKQKLKLCYS